MDNPAYLQEIMSYADELKDMDSYNSYGNYEANSISAWEGSLPDDE